MSPSQASGSPTAAASAVPIVPLAKARKALTAILLQGVTVDGEDPWHVLKAFVDQFDAPTLPPPPALPSVPSGMWANHRRDVEDAGRRKEPHTVYANCWGCSVGLLDPLCHHPEVT